MGADYEATVLTHLIDMLYVAGILVGLIEMIPRPDHLLIENIAVSPPDHGHGYGRLLMDHAEKQARSFGLSEMKLYTNKKFAKNITLYRRLGYRVEREETIEAGVVVHMSKSL